jgi:rsbT co-antagonist protein RsbR
MVGFGSHDQPGQSAAELMELYRIGNEDLDLVRDFGHKAAAHMDGMIGEWYDWLQNQQEFDQFFSDPETLQRVQRLQLGYWQRFMDGSVTDDYVAMRARVGEAHARIGLPLNTYFAGMNMFLDLFQHVVQKEFPQKERGAVTSAVAKLLHLDTAIVVDTYNRIVEDTLTAQAKSLMEMSTPVTQIWSGILLLPIVGIIDSARARDIMNATLAKIAETQARIFILDISGVGVVDTAVANNLIKITRATRLMGCESTISGVSLSDAFHRVGMEIARSHA